MLLSLYRLANCVFKSLISIGFCRKTCIEACKTAVSQCREHGVDKSIKTYGVNSTITTEVRAWMKKSRERGVSLSRLLTLDPSVASLAKFLPR